MSTRPPLILGVSLKLYFDLPDTAHWAQQMAVIARHSDAVARGDVRIVVLPSLPALEATRTAVTGSGIQLGAQDLFWEDRGAYTGGVSGIDLRQAGCSFVEIGHAERRSVFGEDESILRRKFAAAVRNGLTPIVCVGESDPGDDAPDVCVQQLRAALAGLPSGVVVPETILAYEPVWAIGADRPAAPERVDAVAAALHEAADADERLSATSVIYGGSAQPGALSGFGGDVDGLFLGRFAHDPAQFEKILVEASTIV